VPNGWWGREAEVSLLLETFQESIYVFDLGEILGYFLLT
jgi:hypothetical protein